jgi:DNA-binding PadR family transcriptional regulator
MTSDLLQYIMKRNIMIHSMKKRTPTTLEYALLGLVHAEPRSGYDLCKVFETTPMGHYSSSPGAIYPALKRLEGAGLVEGKVEKAGSLRPRKKFTVTPRGEEMLREWVSQSVSRDDLVWGGDELMLRFGFMGQLVTTPTVSGFLAGLAVAAEQYVAELEGHYDGMSKLELPAGVAPTGRLALGQGIESYRVLAKWARQSLAELDQS